MCSELEIQSHISQCHMSCVRYVPIGYAGGAGEGDSGIIQGIQEDSPSGDNCLYSLVPFLMRTGELVLDDGLFQGSFCLVFNKREAMCRIFPLPPCPPQG